MIDQVQISIIEEAQPRWLSFLNGEQDLLEGLPAEFAHIAIPNNQLAPNLAKRGIGMQRVPRADVSVTYFGMEHPLVGGTTPDKVALRRAIALAVDVEREIALVRRGQAVPAQSPIAPGTWGYDRAFKSEMSEHNLARAKALLDLYGYVDRDGDGWRETPDGQPLKLEYATSPDQTSRQLSELWQKNMDALGLRIEFKVAKWPEQLKASRTGKLMMWGVGWSAGQPDADTFLALGYGPNKGQANHARFDLAAFNALYEKQRVLPDGPERQAAARPGQEDHDRLHALQGACAPHQHRPVAPVGAGLRPQHLRARFLEVHRHRCGDAGAGPSLKEQTAANDPQRPVTASAVAFAQDLRRLRPWRAACRRPSRAAGTSCRSPAPGSRSPA